MATLKLVLVGDKWPSKPKLADNIILKGVPADQPLQDQVAEISKALDLEDLSQYDICKGKGKPPDVTAGIKIALTKTPQQVGDKGGLVVLYLREKAEAAPKKAGAGAGTVKLLLCGDKWPPAAKLADHKMVTIKKDALLESAVPEILKVLGIKSLANFSVCKGKGKHPKVTAGAPVPLDRSPEALNLPAAAFLYLKKVDAKQTKKDEAEQKEHTTMYDVGARVEVRDEESGEWARGNIAAVHSNGTYDIALDKGETEKMVEPDDIRKSEETAAEKKDLTADEKRAALKQLIEEFPGKSVPEIGGALKNLDFDVEKARAILGAGAAAEEAKPKAGNKGEVTTVELKLKEPTDPLGIDYRCMEGRMLVERVDAGSVAEKAGLTMCVVKKIAGKEITDKPSVISAVGELRKEKALTIEMEVDTRPESRYWLGAPVEINVEREWEKAVVRKINDNCTFDVELDDGELEEGVGSDEIRLQDMEPAAVEAATATTKSKGQKEELPPVPAVLPDHEGVMKKQGADAFGLYKLRRFALYDTRLYYFHTNKPNPIGMLALEDTTVTADAKKGKDCFSIGGEKLERAYNFLCGSAEEKEDWLQKLEEAGCKVVKSEK